ncbi:MAG: Hsp70 family protein [Proteobacteria bacterium]|jgi:molecular chaperone DnaK|nr:Hsp70 family protein [Pseudomonadota bacterium]
MGLAVGIDLGTTNSCVAVVQGGHAHVVEDLDGKPIQPSVISFLTNGEVVAGHEAKARQIVDPPNTVYSFKRLIGRDLNSPQIQAVVRDLPYEVGEGPGGVPVVRPTSGREVSLPEISAMMLRHLREMTCEVLDREISDAVITVPANFNDVQRSSTKVAGRIAGFNVLRILNEPTAAALAYGLGGSKAERIAVYDFGGGTFDITIIELQDEVYEVLSTAGDTFLGGDDFDATIVEEMRGQFLRDHRYDLSEEQVAFQRVRTVAERVKCQLSSLDEVQATLREIAFGPGGRGIDFQFSLTRARLEGLVAPLVERSLKTCEEALKLAKLDRSALDNVILVGGSTRVPLVRRRVEEFFGQRPLTDINPDEVVAIGAAIHAFSLTGEELPADVVMKKRAGGGAGEPIAPITLKAQQLPPRTPAQQAAQKPAPLPRPYAAFPENKPESTQRTVLGLPKPPPPPPRATEAAEVDEPFGDLPALKAEEFDDFGSLDFDLPAPKKPPPFREDSRGPAPEAVFEGAMPDLGPPELEPPRIEPPPRELDTIAGEREPVALPADEDRRSYAVPSSKGAVSTLLLDVTPRALGVATAGGYCDRIIERNAPIPIEQSRLFSTSTENQTEVLIDVYQGESRRVEENAKLGNVVLAGIRATTRGEVKIRVTFEIDTDGILRVSARNEETGEAQRTEIHLTGGLSENQVADLVAKYAKS